MYNEPSEYDYRAPTHRELVDNYTRCHGEFETERAWILSWYSTPGLKIDVLQLIRTINSNTGLYDIDGVSAALSALRAKIQAESQETLRERDRLLQENLAAQKRAMREETP